MKLQIYQVDAFSRTSFSGNPAAVIPLKKWLPDYLMQQIAEENNLSETAFFVPEGNNYFIRWFTPATEVALCGHATLASAFVLFTELKHIGDTVHFDCQSGPISVTRTGDLFTLDFPVDQLKKVQNIPEGLVEGLGIVPTEVWSGRHDLLCILNTQEEIMKLAPDFNLLKKLPGRGIIVSSLGSGEFDFVSRGFFPQSGINEDPATGSAHTTLTPYWSGIIGKSEMTACQLSSRRGYFIVKNNGPRTLISGKASLYLTGNIFLDL